MTNKYDSMRIDGLTKLHRNRHPKSVVGSRSSFSKHSKKAQRFGYNADLAAVDREIDRLTSNAPRGMIGLSQHTPRPKTIRLRDKV